jgi:2-phospho-L-lactate transferase/gluconeogenesis factor (CofD/UPF0052 family)
MGVAAAPARPVAATGGAHGVVARLVGAQRRAVAMAAIAVTADDDGGRQPAQRERLPEGSIGRQGQWKADDNVCFVKY